MSDEKKPPEEQVAVPVEDRDFKMFVDYCEGMKAADIAIKYGLTAAGVYYVASRDKWRDRRRKYRDQRLKAFSEQLKDQVMKLTQLVLSEAELIAELRKANPKAKLEAGDRAFVLSVLDRLTKETRLDEGKPTEITGNTGTVKHQILLPPGVKKWGVIPPAKNVEQVETKQEESKPNPEEKEDHDF